MVQILYVLILTHWSFSWKYFLKMLQQNLSKTATQKETKQRF